MLLRFAILGLGAGAVYGLTGAGHRAHLPRLRASSTSPRAPSAWSARSSSTSPRQRRWRPRSRSSLALAFGAAIGAATHLLVMRPLRSRPGAVPADRHPGAVHRAARARGTALGSSAHGSWPSCCPSTPSTLLADVTVGKDRLIILGIGVAVTSPCAAVAVTPASVSPPPPSPRTVAPPPRSASRPTSSRRSTGRSAVCSPSSAPILIVNLTGLQVQTLTLLVVPALAAALVGGFRSFPLTFAGGLLIGVLESEIAYLQIEVRTRRHLDGWARSVPFLVIIVVLIVRGRSLPLRGDVAERPPELGSGRVRLRVGRPAHAAVAAVAVTLLDVAVLGATRSRLTAAVGFVTLSVVVVTGYTGQLSLAQFGLAGIGAWIAARLVASYDVPFELAVRSPASPAPCPSASSSGSRRLRTRGVNLAVATLGLALLLESQVLANPARTGGITGHRGRQPDVLRHRPRHVPPPGALRGVLRSSSSRWPPLSSPTCAESRTGRRLVAVRTNERAAAALGISVFGAKLYAFGLGAALRRGRRHPDRLPAPDRRLLPDVRGLRVDLRRRLRGDRRRRVGRRRAPRGRAGPGCPRRRRSSSCSASDLEDIFHLVGGLLLIGILLVDPERPRARSMPATSTISVPVSVALERPAAARGRPADHRAPDGPAAQPSTFAARRVRYGGVTALNDVSLDRPAGRGRRSHRRRTERARPR